jgi:hypothetical protein
MKKSLLVPIVALAALSVLAGSVFAQVQKKPSVVGTWAGTALVNGDGTQIEITVVIDKTETGYSGKLSDTSGAVPETQLRQIVFKDNKLTFEFDLVQGAGSTLIKIELTLDNETLKGVWFDPDGNSGAIDLTLKK